MIPVKHKTHQIFLSTEQHKYSGNQILIITEKKAYSFVLHCYDDTSIKTKHEGNNANHLLFSFGSCLHVSSSSSFNILLTGCFFCRPYSQTYSNKSFNFCFVLHSHRAYLLCPLGTVLSEVLSKRL